MPSNSSHAIPATGHYRPDIDGLRAIAVLGVVAFHYDLALPHNIGLWLGHLLHRPAGLVSLFPKGGFVGVDIFFVISGYLIGGILQREQASNGTISLKRFYERRIRRILPAFASIVFFTDLAAWSGLLPSQMKQFARSAFAATLSCSNLYFWKTSGYFDAPALSQPLLHTWSLAVEEQFYIVFPLLLLWMRRLSNRSQHLVLVACAALSFATSVYLLKADRPAAFYLPVSRAWELLTGVLLASGIGPALHTTKAKNFAGFTGATLVVYATFCYTRQTPFPGVAALVPCLGAALIIAAGSNGASSRLNRLLSARPLVGIGMASYSLYLWHWPLLLINRYEWFAGLHVSDALLVLLLVPVTYLSWRFIEQPFRVGGLSLSRKSVFAVAACVGVLFIALNALAIATGGFPGHFSPQALALDRMLDPASNTAGWRNNCFTSAGLSNLPGDCLKTSVNQPNILLFGDSQAAQLFWGLTHTYPGIHFAVATGSSCKPLLSSYTSSDRFCADMVREVLEHFLPTGQAPSVVLASIWTPADLASLSKTLNLLHDARIHVYVVGPGTYYNEPLPVLLYRQSQSTRTGLIARHLNYSSAEYRQLESGMADATRSSGNSFISLHDLLCVTADRCTLYAAPAIPLQFDGIHLTQQGSLLVADLLNRRHLLP